MVELRALDPDRLKRRPKNAWISRSLSHAALSTAAVTSFRVRSPKRSLPRCLKPTRPLLNFGCRVCERGQRAELRIDRREARHGRKVGAVAPRVHHLRREADVCERDGIA